MNKLLFNFSVFLVLVLALGLILPGCGEDIDEEKQNQESAYEKKEEKEKQEKAENNGERKDDAQKDKEKSDNKETERVEIDYEKVQPNELGEIMILMYHDIGDEDGDWKTSRDNFREHMKRLYEKDYRLVDLMDVVNGKIDIPQGTTPVVLTFDDGHHGQFDLIEKNGEKIVDPDSAAGILLDLEEKYDDFTLAGNFYINRYPEPFAERDNLGKYLEVLTSKGFSVGNHGYNHMHLNRAELAEEVQRELGKVQKMVNETLGDYKLDSLALAYGLWPDDELKEYVYSGEYEGVKYNHKAVLNVGWSPEISPFQKDFAPLDLERIRANDGEEQEMDRWLEDYENNPEKRYVSDGNPDTIVFPEGKEENLREDVKENYEVITY